MEMEALEMANKLLEQRCSLPDLLKTTLTSILSSQRPNFPDFVSDLDSDLGEEGTCSQSALRDQKTAEKLHLLKDRISSNAAAMPIVVKRVEGCISKIDNLESYSGVMHPAFRKKK